MISVVSSIVEDEGWWQEIVLSELTGWQELKFIYNLNKDL